MRLKALIATVLIGTMLAPIALAADKTVTLGPYRWILTEADGYAITDWRQDTDGDGSFTDETDLVADGIYMYLRAQNVSTLANTTAAGANATEYLVYDNRSIRVNVTTANQTQLENIFIHADRNGTVNANLSLRLLKSDGTTLVKSTTIQNTTIVAAETWHKAPFYQALDKNTNYWLQIRTTDSTGTAGSAAACYRISLDAALSAANQTQNTTNWQNLTASPWNTGAGDACIRFEMDRHDEWTQIQDSTPASGSQSYADENVVKYVAKYGYYNNTGTAWDGATDGNVTYWFYRDGRVKMTVAGRIDDPGSLTTEVEEVFLKLDLTNGFDGARSSSTTYTSDGTDDTILMPATDYVICYDSVMPTLGLAWVDDQNFTDRSTTGYGLTVAEPNVTLDDDTTAKLRLAEVRWVDESTPANLTGDVQFSETFWLHSADEQSTYTHTEDYLQMGIAEYTSNGNSLVNSTTATITKWSAPTDQNQVELHIIGESGTHRIFWTFPASKEINRCWVQYADGTFKDLSENSAYGSGSEGYCDATSGTGEIYVRTTDNTGKTYIYIDYKPETSVSHTQGQAGSWGGGSETGYTGGANITGGQWLGAFIVAIMLFVGALIVVRKEEGDKW